MNETNRIGLVYFTTQNENYFCFTFETKNKIF